MSMDRRNALLIAVLIFLNVAIFGCLFLMVTGKVVP